MIREQGGSRMKALASMNKTKIMKIQSGMFEACRKDVGVSKIQKNNPGGQ